MPNKQKMIFFSSNNGKEVSCRKIKEYKQNINTYS